MKNKAGKNSLIGATLEEIKENNAKQDEINKGTIAGIKHTGKVFVLRVVCDLLFWLFLIGFVLVWYYYEWNFRRALEMSATWIMEYFILGELKRRKQRGI